MTTERFWAQVERQPSGCMLWMAAKTAKGYGVHTHEKRAVYAHRFSWTRTRGEIPEGLYVLHHCDVRNCVNPEHLFLGTTQDNTKDMCSKDRVSHGERHRYAKLTEQEVVEIRQRRASGETGVSLAKVYGVRDSTISRIVHKIRRARCGRKAETL